MVAVIGAFARVLLVATVVIVGGAASVAATHTTLPSDHLRLFHHPTDVVEAFHHLSQERLTREQAEAAYVNSLIYLLTGATTACPLDAAQIACLQGRQRGTAEPATVTGVTMIGALRLRNIEATIRYVARDGIEGGFVEAGVWRGGATIFTTALTSLIPELRNRTVFVVDSFQGLPPPRADSLRKNEAHFAAPNSNRTLAVSLTHVRNNYILYGLANELWRVQFFKGYFIDSAPTLRRACTASPCFAMLRLDGDMYDSTVDLLYNLYDLLAVGGIVIIDDFSWSNAEKWGARAAVLDFMAVHNITSPLVNIDDTGAWFRKEKQIELQRWRYTEKPNQFVPANRDQANIASLRPAWERSSIAGKSPLALKRLL